MMNVVTLIDVGGVKFVAFDCGYRESLGSILIMMKVDIATNAMYSITCRSGSKYQLPTIARNPSGRSLQ